MKVIKRFKFFQVFKHWLLVLLGPNVSLLTCYDRTHAPMFRPGTLTPLSVGHSSQWITVIYGIPRASFLGALLLDLNQLWINKDKSPKCWSLKWLTSHIKAINKTWYGLKEQCYQTHFVAKFKHTHSRPPALNNLGLKSLLNTQGLPV